MNLFKHTGVKFLLLVLVSIGLHAAPESDNTADINATDIKGSKSIKKYPTTFQDKDDDDDDSMGALRG